MQPGYDQTPYEQTPAPGQWQQPPQWDPYSGEPNSVPYAGQEPVNSFNPFARGDSFENFVNEDPSQPEAQQTKGKKARVIKTKKPRRRKLNCRGWILAILLLALIAFGVYTLLRNKSGIGGTSTVQIGKMGENHTGTALIVRNETAFDEEGVQAIDFKVKEGSLVSRGEVICWVYSTGYTAKEVSTLQGYRDQIKEYQSSLISAETSYDQKMTRLENDVIDRGLEVRSLVHGAKGDLIVQEESLSEAITERQNYIRTKYSSDTRMDRLFDEENTQLQRIDSWIKQKIATSEGVVSFYTDGFESALTPSTYSQYSPSEVRSMIAGNKPTTSSAARGRTTLYRMVHQQNYVVLLLVDDTGWNPEEGRNYKLVLERYNDLVADAMVLSYTRTGGELLVRLAVSGDARDVLYMRTCTAQIGDYVDCMMVPEGAIYQQGGTDGVVILDNGKSVFVPVTILGRSGGYAYISATVAGSLAEGQTVRLFQ